MARCRSAFVLVLLFLPALVAVPGVVQPSAHTDVEAHDVMDKDSLQAFVKRAKAEVEEHVSDNDGVYDFADMTFRPMGEWHDGPIYIFILTTEGDIHFHGARMDREGTNLYSEVDSNGVQFTKDLIDAAAMGGDFVEYLFDNPDVMGDEDEGSPKVGYAEELTFEGEDTEYVIGSGFYPATDVPVAPPLAYLILAALLAGAGYLRRRPR